MKSDDQCTERKMNKGVYKCAGLAFFPNADEKINSNFRLKNMRYADQEKADNRQFFDGFFHKSPFLNLRADDTLPN